MRRIVLLLGLMAAMLTVFAAAAFAVNETGTQGPDTINGTDSADSIYGLNGSDVIRGLGGNDYLEGGKGDDLVSGGSDSDKIHLGGGNDVGSGGPGNDSLYAVDGVVSNDFVGGGTGTNDKCYVDSEDEAGGNCEHVFIASERV